MQWFYRVNDIWNTKIHPIYLLLIPETHRQICLIRRLWGETTTEQTYISTQNRYKCKNENNKRVNLRLKNCFVGTENSSQIQPMRERWVAYHLQVNSPKVKFTWVIRIFAVVCVCVCVCGIRHGGGGGGGWAVDHRYRIPSFTHYATSIEVCSKLILFRYFFQPIKEPIFTSVQSHQYMIITPRLYKGSDPLLAHACNMTKMEHTHYIMNLRLYINQDMYVSNDGWIRLSRLQVLTATN